MTVAGWVHGLSRPTVADVVRDLPSVDRILYVDTDTRISHPTAEQRSCSAVRAIECVGVFGVRSAREWTLVIAGSGDGQP